MEFSKIKPCISNSGTGSAILSLIINNNQEGPSQSELFKDLRIKEAAASILKISGFSSGETTDIFCERGSSDKVNSDFPFVVVEALSTIYVSTPAGVKFIEIELNCIIVFFEISKYERYDVECNTYI